MGLSELEINTNASNSTDDLSDDDECNETELKNYFGDNLNILKEHQVTTEGSYILHMDCAEYV